MAEAQLEKLRETIDPIQMFNIYTGFAPYSYQSKILLDNNDIILFKSGRQVGKSEVISIVSLQHALEASDKLVLITAASERQARIIYDKIRAVFLRHKWMEKYVERMNNEEIVFANRSRILVLPSGEGYTIRGFTPTLIIVDEAAYVKDIVYTAIEPMMIHGSKLVLIGSPFGQRGRFWDLWNANDKHISKYAVTCYDCLEEVLEPQKHQSMLNVIERAKNTKTENEFRQEYLGEFVTDEDTYFSRELILNAVSDIIEQHSAEPNYRYFLGVDLARYGADESVYTISSYDGELVKVVHIQSTSKKPLTDSMGRIQELHNNFRFDKIFIDESGLGGGSVDFLKERNLPIEPVTFTLKNKEELYKNLKLLMEKNQLRIPDNKKLIDQLANLQYDYTSTRLMRIHHPDNGHDDYPDSLALACFGARSKNIVIDWGDDDKKLT
jgi:phage FluMu gp28-like protein